MRAGDFTPPDVPVSYVRREGNVLILNTRSAVALELAGIPRTRWIGEDGTGDPFHEELLTQRLKRNRLPASGIMSVRRSGTRQET